MTATVHTQAELDAALAAKESLIYIESTDGARLHVANTDYSHVEAWGYSHVVARGYSHVVARDSSHVEAWDYSHVVAWGYSHVVARGSSHVEARDSSHVVAWGSSHVVAWDYSHVVAWGYSHVVARGSSHVVAWDYSHVEAGKYVAVHLHSQRVELSGGVVIDMTAIDRDDPRTWIEMYGGKTTDGKLTVYKGVDANLRSKYGTTYPIGETVTASDWASTKECGQGLHFSPSPTGTHAYCEPKRYLECTVDAGSFVPLGDKIKSKSCVVVREVDKYGKPVSK